MHLLKLNFICPTLGVHFICPEYAALLLLMITTSACFAQNWKSFVKGVEDRIGGKNNPQTKEQTKTNETTESADTKNDRKTLK